MTANERLAEIKARAEADAEYRKNSLSPVLISQTQWDRERLLAALEAVLELHQPDEFTECRNCHSGQGEAHPHPCPTVQAVNEALGVDQ